MRVEIEGVPQGSIEVELQLLPRIGETIKVWGLGSKHI